MNHEGPRGATALETSCPTCGFICDTPPDVEHIRTRPFPVQLLCVIPARKLRLWMKSGKDGRTLRRLGALVETMTQGGSTSGGSDLAVPFVGAHGSDRAARVEQQELLEPLSAARKTKPGE